MFLQNKYYRWYMVLVATDDQSGYREKHHKIPRSLGGNGSKSNMVLLSPRKHFIVHWLLTKCTKGEHQRAMFWAFACMVSKSVRGKKSIIMAVRACSRIIPRCGQRETIPDAGPYMVSRAASPDECFSEG